MSATNSRVRGAIEGAREGTGRLKRCVMGRKGIRKGRYKGVAKSARFWLVVNRWAHPPRPPSTISQRREGL